MIMGGPGGSCRNPNFSHICWALLDHCDKDGVRIDFISFHKKGHENWEYSLEEELATIQYIRDTYLNLKDVPIINDESDFLVGWSRPHEWRADARYATLVVNSIVGHLSSRILSYNYHLMSFDNAFLSYQPWIFHQRTMMARFQINNTTPHDVHLIKKPSYSIYSLLSLLGDHITTSYISRENSSLTVLSTCRGCRLPEAVSNFTTEERSVPDGPSDQSWLMASIQEETISQYSNITLQSKSTIIQTNEQVLNNTSQDFNIPLPKKSPFLWNREQALESFSEWESSTVITFSNGTDNNTSITQLIDITVQLPYQLDGEVLWLVVYSIGGCVPGPYVTWMSQGQPKEPTREQLSQLRASEGATRQGPQSVVGIAGKLRLSINMTLPEVVLIHICKSFDSTPGRVVNVNTLPVTSIDVLISWSDENIDTRCILSYEVQWSEQEDGPWIRISPGNITDNNFLFSLDNAKDKDMKTVVGWYRIRAVTYWGLTGNFSLPVHHQNKHVQNHFT